VFTEDGVMYLQRCGNMKPKMAVLKKDEYSLEGIPGTHLVFERDGNGWIIPLRSLQKDGKWDVSNRDK